MIKEIFQDPNCKKAFENICRNNKKFSDLHILSSNSAVKI